MAFSTNNAGLPALTNNQLYKGVTNGKPVACDLNGIGNIAVTPNGDDLDIDGTALLPKSGGTMTGALTLAADPVSALQAATKQYVDALAALGLDFKASVACATTGALTATYANGTAGVGATLTNAGVQAAFSSDGITPSVGARILVKNQASTFQNGVYTLTVAGNGSTNWVLTRATDFDTAAEITPGAFVAVDAGTTLALTSFLQTATVVTVGTDPIVFSQFTYGTSFPSLSVAGNITNAALTASKLVLSDGSKNLSSSSLGETDLLAKVSQSGAQIYAATATGNDTYVVTLSPAPASLVDGMSINVKLDVANTGPATINVNGLGAVAITKLFNQALVTGDMLANQIVNLVYNSTGPTWQLQSQISQVATVTGAILQTVQTTKTNSFTTTSTSATDITGMSQAITPSSASNKVLVIVQIAATLNGTNSFFINLLRDSTQIFMGDTAGSRVRTTIFSRGQDSNFPCPMFICFLDSPATTSAVTYKLQGYVEAGTLNVNQSNSDADNNAYGRSVSSITLMEVKG